MAILSIQSRVVSGYVGNSAATPILQRLGRTVWPVDTVAFSNHPAHGAYRGETRPAAEVEALIDGLDAQNLLASCDAVLSGYLGTAAMGRLVLDAADRVRAANSEALWFCDPVMGDQGNFYVAAGIAEFFRDHAVAAADVILPNTFEAAYLSGTAVDSTGAAAHAAAVLMGKGPATVIISGLRHGDTVGAIAATKDGCWQCMAPAIDAPAYGAGDAFAALFVGEFLVARDVPGALGHAVSGVHTILRATADVHARDLQLIEALPHLGDLPPLPVEKFR